MSDGTTDDGAPRLTPATVALVAEARDRRRRGVVFAACVVGTYWHFWYHDYWWETPAGAGAHTVLSVILVAGVLWSRPLAGLALLVGGPVQMVWLLGALLAWSEWEQGNVVVVRVWDSQGECRVDREIGLQSCPLAWRLPNCFSGPDYYETRLFASSVAMRTAMTILGPPPGSYNGHFPSEAEVTALVGGATPLDMTREAVAAVFREAAAPDTSPDQWEWHGTRSLGVVRLDDPERPGLLFSWDGGEVIELYDVRSSALVARWERPGYERPTLRSLDLHFIDNAVWLRRRWLHAATTQEEVERLLSQTSRHGITTLYPFVGPLKPGGSFGWRDGEVLREYDPETARLFLERAHGPRAPEATATPGGRDLPLLSNLDQHSVVILPWTGGIYGRDAFPSDPAWRADFVAQAKALVDLGADGIHVNIEPMPETDTGYLDLLRELQAALGPDKLVSVAAYPPPTPLHPFPDIHWSTPFLREVCAIADDVSVMTYDTALTTPEAYADLVKTWTLEITTALTPEMRGDPPLPVEGGPRCRWRVGVPTYDDDEAWHRPGAETMSAALDGVIGAFGGNPLPTRGPGSFVGLAVYSSWTTDGQEWAEFDIRWNGFGPRNVDRIDPE